MTQLWLDDIRSAPEGWTWVKTYDDAVALLKTGGVEDASLDHDLGYYDAADPDRNEDEVDHYSPAHYPQWLFQYNNSMLTGYDVVKWMAQNNVWPSKSCAVHSANASGAIRMQDTINQFGGYAKMEMFNSGHRKTWGVVFYGKKESKR